MGDWFKSLGCYPPGYNQKVHGTYVPFRYYGPVDTPLKDVKLADLKDWVLRRDRSPRNVARSISRLAHLWTYKWARPRNATGAVIVQYCFVASTLWYLCSFGYNRSYKHREFH